ncbi:MAG TPA: hypothetical protein PLQ93_11420 [Bacteroidia bacterium]|nr:hypothetical protein [Bacteroidia bacterium]
MLALLLLFWFTKAYTQDSLVKSDKSSATRKNTIRYNISNPLIFGESAIIFGYERTIGKHKSFCIDLGNVYLRPPVIDDFDYQGTKFSASKTTSDFGFHSALDFRFYLKKENRYDAPRGIYIAPYYSYNLFKRENTWILNTASLTSTVVTSFKFQMNTVGCEMGYQFLLWKRLALDFILIGPGVTFYNIQTGLSTSLSAEQESQLFQKINDALAGRIPGYNLVIDGREYEKKGSVNTTALGFRYMVHIGFRF